MKVSELSGERLNEWVAKAEGKEVLIIAAMRCYVASKFGPEVLDE